MKLHILSDLHLEFDEGYKIFDPPKVDANILVLAGDIWVGQPPIHWLEEVCSRYEQVFYLPGNHEYYLGHTFQLLNKEYKELEYHIPNFVFLHNDYYDYNFVTFIGATLWTDYNKNDSMTKMIVKECMNDYRLMRYAKNGQVPKVTSEDLYEEHQFSVKFLEQELKKPAQKRVVITHHCPSFKSVHPKYHGDKYMNYGFYSDLDHLIEQADCWIHGHSHSPMDYQLGKCRVICNPRGYQRRGEDTGFNPELVVEV